MSRFFQLLDVITGNVVTEFNSERETIEALRHVQAEEGDGPLLELALFRFEDEHPSLIAKQEGLVDYLACAGATAAD